MPEIPVESLGAGRRHLGSQATNATKTQLITKPKSSGKAQLHRQSKNLQKHPLQEDCTRAMWLHARAHHQRDNALQDEYNTTYESWQPMPRPGANTWADAPRRETVHFGSEVLSICQAKAPQDKLCDLVLSPWENRRTMHAHVRSEASWHTETSGRHLDIHENTPLYITSFVCSTKKQKLAGTWRHEGRW